ncbi:MAG TPA: NAD(P)-dependent oxidoreductase [Pirellulales bacterium]
MSFRVGITRDFLKPDGTLGFGDIGLDLLDQSPRVEWEFMAEACQEIPPQAADGYDALLVLAPRVTARTVDGCRRLSLVARFGVGYDNVDVDACTRNDVILSITPEGVRRPVATSALALLLALSHKLLTKDRLTREGRWAEKLDHMGAGLTGRTLGVIGLGNIGRELFRLAAPLEMRHVGFDPYFTSEAAAAAGIEWQPLDGLLAESDFVVVCCALTPETHHLLDAGRLRLLKPAAYLVNVARGPIIDQAALTDILQRRVIAGAALDVFETEPIAADDPLLKLDNVIVSPHAICWTDELFLRNGQVACRHILDVAEGRVPGSVVNADVLERAAMREKLRRYARDGA